MALVCIFFLTQLNAVLDNPANASGPKERTRPAKL